MRRSPRSSMTISCSFARRSERGSFVQSSPSSQRRSNATISTGILLRIRSISAGDARFMRCWSSSNDVLPDSSVATISPSRTAFVAVTRRHTRPSSG